MDELQRVTFRFGGVTEVHYLESLPDVGDRVTHGRELWVVADVDADGVDALVICERPTASGAGTRGLVESSV
jgi:hypothetical protein